MRYGFAIAYNNTIGIKKGADTEKQGVGTFWALFDFTLIDSLDMIKIENVFTGCGRTGEALEISDTESVQAEQTGQEITAAISQSTPETTSEPKPVSMWKDYIM